MEVKWGLKTLDLKTVPEICKEFPISETCLYGLIHKKKVPFWECGRKYLLNLPDVISALHVPVETNGVEDETKVRLSETDLGNDVTIAGRPEHIEEHFDDPEQIDPEDEELENELGDPEIPPEDDVILDPAFFDEELDLGLPEDIEVKDDLNQEENELDPYPTALAAAEFLTVAPEKCTWILDANWNMET